MINMLASLGKVVVGAGTIIRSLFMVFSHATRPLDTILYPEVKGEDISGSYGNPELEPYEADNFDLSLEYYGEGMTFASIGIFRKNIDNAIYPTLQKTKTINGISFNDGVETWINGQDSHVNGLELNFQYGWENGAYIATNLTFTDSESLHN